MLEGALETINIAGKKRNGENRVGISRVGGRGSLAGCIDWWWWMEHSLLSDYVVKECGLLIVVSFGMGNIRPSLVSVHVEIADARMAHAAGDHSVDTDSI